MTLWKQRHKSISGTKIASYYNKIHVIEDVIQMLK